MYNQTININGYLQDDPRYRTTSGGKKVADLIVAVNVNPGIRKEHEPGTVFYKCHYWGESSVAYCQQNLVRGCNVEILGSLHTMLARNADGTVYIGENGEPKINREIEVFDLRNHSSFQYAETEEERKERLEKRRKLAEEKEAAAAKRVRELAEQMGELPF